MNKFNFDLSANEALKKGVNLVRNGVRQGVNVAKQFADTRSAEGSFIAISDFHGYEYPLDKIKNYYLDEYDYIYILGDATDRGPTHDGAGSIKLLQEIKELSEKYPGRVVYIPGNHDQFLLGSAYGDNNCRLNTFYNGGAVALDELDHLKKSNPREFNQLVSWLEKLPLQKTHVYDGKKYVFAHAFFNQRLYDMNPNFSLKDFFNTANSNLKEDLNKVLWFRKSKNEYYSVEDCPTADSIMVIGHTPVDRGPDSYDLVDKNNRKVKVHCVDGGIAYSGGMLKFDGAFEPIRTEFYGHVNTSPKKVDFSAKGAAIERPKKEVVSRKNITPSSGEKTTRDARLLNAYILKRVYEEGEAAFDVSCDDIPGNILSSSECISIINSYEGKNGFSYEDCSDAESYSLYKKVVVFDMVLQKLMAKYDDLGIVDIAMSGFIFGGEDAEAGNKIWITRDNDARLFATSLGVQNMKKVLSAHNCSSVGEYITANANKVKQYAK